MKLNQKEKKANLFRLVTDFCIVCSWDKNMLAENGGWELNPEYAEELKNRPREAGNGELKYIK